MVALTLRNTKGSPLTNTEVDANFSNLNAAVQPAGGTAGQVLSKVDGTDYNSTWIDNYSTALQVTVKAGVALTKGQAVYITGASGANIIVGLAKADAEATSSKTFGLINASLATNGFGNVVCEGPISGIDTSTATEGDPVWLSPTVAGGLVFGLANKPSAPNHLVYLGVVSRSHATQGQIQVKVQNGFEMEELHNVAITSAAAGDVLIYNFTTKCWENKAQSNITAGAVPWSGVSGKPTTVSGYGITDAITTANIGSQSVSYAATAGSANAVTWANVSGKPTSASYFSDAITTGNIGSQSVNYATSAGTATTATQLVNGARAVQASSAGSWSSWDLSSATTTEGGLRILGSSGSWMGTFYGDGTAQGFLTSASGWSFRWHSASQYYYGDWRATGNVTAYYSDERFKTKVGKIENALEKVKSLEGFYYVENDLARSFGYKSTKQQVALSAQSVQAVMPEAVHLAAVDSIMDENTGEFKSISGENYLTVDYERLVPLLVEAIKTLEEKVAKLEAR